MSRPDTLENLSLATFRFFGNLKKLLKRRYDEEPVTYRFREHPGIKDAIEAMGVPHTEVNVIMVNGRAARFDYQLDHLDTVGIYPIDVAVPEPATAHLCPPPPEPVAFVLDVHLGKLARRLRLLGFDAQYRNDYSDAEILQESDEQNRIILTRDRGILKHRRVVHGYLVRSGAVDEQVVEIISRYRLHDRLRPWSRCLACNGLLENVEKSEIDHRLEPKTRLYFERFRRCRDFGHIYWQGTNVEKLDRWLDNLIPGRFLS